MTLTPRQIHNRLHKAADTIDAHGRSPGKLMRSNGACCAAGAVALACGAPADQLLGKTWFLTEYGIDQMDGVPIEQQPKWARECSDVLIFIEAHLLALFHERGIGEAQWAPFYSVTSFSDHTRKPVLVDALRWLGDLAVQ